uniref:Uncharacterized protein n=1 Tax=Vespula pensylvanica TaxID=30213 RepID=A0A834K8M0_VESPE|nr:hypothetical protein H0235_015226 [Vespula pensylvanica]
MKLARRIGTSVRIYIFKSERKSRWPRREIRSRKEEKLNTSQVAPQAIEGNQARSRAIPCYELNSDVPGHNYNHITSNNIENNFGNDSSIRLKISESRGRNSQSGSATVLLFTYLLHHRSFGWFEWRRG